MAWIESHIDLETHPKTKALKISMGWDLDQTIGKLHRFWWWCLKYAEDGDLRKFNDAQIGDAVGLDGESCKKFVENMVAAGFLERVPFFRVHDWLDRVERYLVSKYHTSNPLKLKDITRKHRGMRVGKPKGVPKGKPLGDPPNLPNRTLPTLPKDKTLADSKPSAGGAVDNSKTENGRYEIETPQQFVMAAFKLARGVDISDREWDKDNWARYSKAAKELLRIFDNNQEKAAKCIGDLSAYFNGKKLDWTLDTVAKRASDWKIGLLRV